MRHHVKGKNPRRPPGRPPAAPGGGGRQALVQAARELLAERGLPGITLRGVAERAGVQPALGNYYFGGKDGLLRAVTHLVANEARERMEQALKRQGSVEERLRGLIASLVEAMAADPYCPRLVVEEVLFGKADVIDSFVAEFAKPTLQSIKKLPSHGHRTGAIRSVDPLYLVPSFLGMCVFFLLSTPILRRVFDLRVVEAEHLENLTQSVGDLLMHGIATGGSPR